MVVRWSRAHQKTNVIRGRRVDPEADAGERASAAGLAGERDDDLVEREARAAAQEHHAVDGGPRRQRVERRALKEDVCAVGESHALRDAAHLSQFGM